MKYKVGDIVWAECRCWTGKNGHPLHSPTGNIHYIGPVKIRYGSIYNDSIVYRVTLPIQNDGWPNTWLVKEKQLHNI